MEKSTIYFYSLNLRFGEKICNYSIPMAHYSQTSTAILQYSFVEMDHIFRWGGNGSRGQEGSLMPLIWSLEDHISQEDQTSYGARRATEYMEPGGPDQLWSQEGHCRRLDSVRESNPSPWTEVLRLRWQKSCDYAGRSPAITLAYYAGIDSKVRLRSWVKSLTSIRSCDYAGI